MADQKRDKRENKSKSLMIPYGRQYIDREDINEVIKTLKSDWLTQGPKVAEFEKKLANHCGSRFAVAVANGTAGLHLAYLAAEIGAGDEVITTPNTFVATSNMLLAVGAKPVFCDIRLDNYNIDENKIEKLITEKTAAIVPVDFAGHPVEFSKIKKIAKKYNLLIIEDACHALGAKYQDKKIGSLADLTVFSFHPVKSITTGEGGAILTDRKDLYQKMLNLRSHGIKKNALGINIMSELGYNYRLTDIQATLGISQLKKLDNFLKKRHEIVAWYREELANFDQVILPTEPTDVYSSWHIFVIRAKNKRNGLVSFLKKSGIGVNMHYPAAYGHPFYRKLGYGTKLTNMEIYQKSCITLPIFYSMTREQVKYVSDKIKEFYSKK